MKKLHFLFVIMILLITACGNKQNIEQTIQEIKYAPPQLEQYDGYVVIGIAYNSTQKTKQIVLKDSIENQVMVDADAEILEMYNLGDTIKVASVNCKNYQDENIVSRTSFTSDNGEEYEIVVYKKQ